MSGALQALVALDAAIDRGLVGRLLTARPDQLGVIDYVELQSPGAGDDARGDVLIIGCGEYGAAVGEFVARVRRLHPTRPTVLVCQAASNGYVGEAFDAGADDIVTLPRDAYGSAADLPAQLLFALEKAVARRRGATATTVDASRRLGRVIAILGLKGGSGKTLTTGNLAVALAAAGKRVAIVDLDLQFGDIGLALGLHPDRTSYDLARAGGSLDTEKVADFMTVHASGVRVLLSPTRPDQGGAVTAEFLRTVYPLLREMHDFVLLDTPPGFTPEVIAAIDAARDICLVSMLDALSLKNTRLGIETLQRLDYGGRVRMVLNRADSNVGIAPADVVEIVGRTPDVLVPSDRNITRSMNRGEPIALSARRSDAARAFNALAHLYLADPETAGEDAVPATRRRLLRRR